MANTALYSMSWTEGETAFYSYTRLPRRLYAEVLRRIEGRIKKKDTV